MSRPRHAAPQRQDLYARVTTSIVADLEQGVRPWTKPWRVEPLAGRVSRPLRSTGEPYRGVNVVLLWCEAVSRGYAAPIWMTFRQALALGGHVRKGEKGSTVVYAGKIVRAEPGDIGDEVERAVPFLKAYTVFNVEQMDGLPDRFHALAGPSLSAAERVEQADRFFENLGGALRQSGDMAYYDLQADLVQTPPFGCFADAVSYYATLAHEFTHWTRHPTRLDRDLGGMRLGDERYAREELVAELGAAFLCADLGLELTPREDHAAYLGHWLKVLKAEPRFLFTAAAHAQRACDYLLSLQAAEG